MKCTICKKEVILKPTATERARKYGETPDYYTKLFPTHVKCQLAKDKESVSKLMAHIREQTAKGKIIYPLTYTVPQGKFQ